MLNQTKMEQNPKNSLKYFDNLIFRFEIHSSVTKVKTRTELLVFEGSSANLISALTNYS